MTGKGKEQKFMTLPVQFLNYLKSGIIIILTKKNN
jgi:hypothetical protein